MRYILGVIGGLILAACASMGRPEGGEKDYDPPVYLRSNPSPGQLNFSGNRLTIMFDENVQLEDAMSKVVLSPAQKTPPVVKANGHRVTVELRDTLLPNTTYTLDFADAIKDLNEGNVLDGLAIDFSTGDFMDSLRISGMVFEARTLEPAQGMLVGAYTAETFVDTTLTTVPFERIAKTNQLGQFTLRNLKPGTYRVFAVNDVNRDYHWDRSEDIAVYPAPVTPSARRVMRPDTIRTPDGRDSIFEREVTEYSPADLLLTWFNEEYKTQYLADYSRPEPNKISLRMGAPSDSLPILRLVNTDRAGADLAPLTSLEASATLDTLVYWLRDSSLILNDTLLIATTYLRTDTNSLLTARTDTLRFLNKNARKQKKDSDADKKKKKDSDAEAEQADTLPPPIPALDLRLAGGGQQELNRGLTFKVGAPVEHFDSASLHLEMMYEGDSVWTPLKSPLIERRSPLSPLDFQTTFAWDPGTKYRVTIDSAAFTDIYGHVNKQLRQELTTKKLDEYSSIILNITGIPAGEKAVVELLSTSDKVVATAPVGPSGVTPIDYLTPATYYARLYVDANADGEWTRGSVADSIQPEDVYYYPKRLVLKKNWTIEQAWDINELAVDAQKPDDIKKNKPKKKRTREDDERDKNSRRDSDSQYDDEYDEFFDDPFMNSRRQGGSSSTSRPSNSRLRPSRM